MSSHGGHGNNNYKPTADRPLARAIYNSECGGAKTSRFSQDRPVAITSCPPPSPQPHDTKKTCACSSYPRAVSCKETIYVNISIIIMFTDERRSTFPESPGFQLTRLVYYL